MLTDENKTKLRGAKTCVRRSKKVVENAEKEFRANGDGRLNSAFHLARDIMHSAEICIDIADNYGALADVFEYVGDSYSYYGEDFAADSTQAKECTTSKLYAYRNSDLVNTSAVNFANTAIEYAENAVLCITPKPNNNQKQ